MHCEVKWGSATLKERNMTIVDALVDTGTTHNFIVDQEAKRFGLKLAKCLSCMKIVNLDAKPILGSAKGVNI